MHLFVLSALIFVRLLSRSTWNPPQFFLFCETQHFWSSCSDQESKLNSCLQVYFCRDARNGTRKVFNINRPWNIQVLFLESCVSPRQILLMEFIYASETCLRIRFVGNVLKYTASLRFRPFFASCCARVYMDFYFSSSMYICILPCGRSFLCRFSPCGLLECLLGLWVCQ